MERYHENELNLMIETLIDLGAVKIAWYKVYRWYGAERMSKKNYRDLYDRIEERVGDKVTVMCIKNAGCLILIINDKLESFKSFFEE